jgi:hypothetical protein
MRAAPAVMGVRVMLSVGGRVMSACTCLVFVSKSRHVSCFHDIFAFWLRFACPSSRADLLLLLKQAASSNIQEIDKTMVTAVEIPESTSSNDDDASKKRNDHDTLLVLPSSSPVPSNASSDQDDDESVVVLRQEEEKENGKHHLVASVNDASLSSPITKKRRVHSHHHHQHQQHQWNAFVRQGTSLKGLLGNVLQLATTSTSTAAASSSSDEDIPTTRDGETALLERMRPLHHQHAADLAREKTRECMILEKVRILVLHLKFYYCYILLTLFCKT